MTKTDWKKCKLGDALNFRRGYDLPKDQMSGKGYPVVGSNGIIGYHKEYTTEAPCLVIGRSGNTGIPALYKYPCWAHNTTLFIDNFKGNYPRFLYYLLKTMNLQSYAAGSAVPTLNRNHIHPLDISLPPLDEQKRIAEILGSLDDKIELLQKQNKTLEDMAKALFKSWFVDFDVVRAKQKGLPKADIMREYHLTEELYDLFPSSFADSPLGPIPSGWEVKNVGELLAFGIGGGWGNEEESESFPIKAPVIRGTDIPSLRSSGAYNDVPVRFHKKSNHTSRELKEGDIVLEVAGGSKGQPVGRALFVSDYIIKSLPKVICASFCKLLRPNKKLLLSELFYLYLDMMYQTGEIEQYQVQSTGISNFQFKQFCEDKQFVIPNTELQKKLSLNVYIDKIGNNKKQIQTLTELRDTLLPRLISGKIRV